MKICIFRYPGTHHVFFFFFLQQFRSAPPAVLSKLLFVVNFLFFCKFEVAFPPLLRPHYFTLHNNTHCFLSPNGIYFCCHNKNGHYGHFIEAKSLSACFNNSWNCRGLKKKHGSGKIFCLFLSFFGRKKKKSRFSGFLSFFFRISRDL